jgi:hypothetical protein
MFGCLDFSSVMGWCVTTTIPTIATDIWPYDGSLPQVEDIRSGLESAGFSFESPN